MSLHVLGWNDFFERHWNSSERRGLTPGRVVEEQKETYRVVAEGGEMAAVVTGKLRHKAAGRSGFPAVGDWVALDPVPTQNHALIHEVLPRRTKLSRRAAGIADAEQILVANVDVAFIVTSLNADFNVRRLERYLAAIWESGSQPVVLLSKADLCSDSQSAADEILSMAPGVGVHALSAITGEGMDALTPYIGAGRTVVLLGSSGVGKSTIINALLGSETQKTLEVRRRDDRGRHATSYRRLFLMPSGGVLIDTPGMREFQLWDNGAGLGDGFEEIGQLSTGCRFRDCQHETEPGCAVLGAVENGTLDRSRIENYRKMKRELEFLERRHDPAAQAELKKVLKARSRALKYPPKLFE